MKNKKCTNESTILFPTNLFNTNIHNETDEVENKESTHFIDYLCNTSLDVPHV